MLRQTEWRLQNGPITKGGVFPVTASSFFLRGGGGGGGAFVPVLESLKTS